MRECGMRLLGECLPVEGSMISHSLRFRDNGNRYTGHPWYKIRAKSRREPTQCELKIMLFMDECYMGVIFEWAKGVVNSNWLVSAIRDGPWPETFPETATDRGNELLVWMGGGKTEKCQH